MAARITVNGVTYESVDDLPPDVRRLYEQTLKNVPALAVRDGDGTLRIVRGMELRDGAVHGRIVVNGKAYEGKAGMPPDVLELYEQAMRSLDAASSPVQRNAVTMSFQVTGPGLDLRAGSIPPSPLRAVDPAAQGAFAVPSSAATPKPAPIEPAPDRLGLRIVIILAAFAAGAMTFWLLARLG